MATDTDDRSPARPGGRAPHRRARGVCAASDGTRIVYDDVGNVDAPPIVLLHGITESRLMWHGLVDVLAERFRVLAVDQRGHGESDRLTGGVKLPDLAGDVVALCEQVLEQPAVLIGNSLGGAVSAIVAAIRPDLVEGILLEDPATFVMDPDVFPSTAFAVMFPMLETTLREAHATDDPEATLADLLTTMPAMNGKGTLANVLGEDGRRRLARSWALADIEYLRHANGQFDMAAIWGDHDPDAEITCPVTVIRADPDLGPAFFPEHEDRFRSLAPHARFVVAHGRSHMIHVEAPEWFARQVEAFLDDLQSFPNGRERRRADFVRPRPI